MQLNLQEIADCAQIVALFFGTPWCFIRNSAKRVQNSRKSISFCRTREGILPDTLFKQIFKPDMERIPDTWRKSISSAKISYFAEISWLSLHCNFFLRNLKIWQN